MHLDPDFDYLTYGDRGAKGRQISTSMKPGDLIVFYASLRNIRSSAIIYAVVVIFLIDYVRKAVEFEKSEACRNAHTRRQLASGSDDIVVVARAGVSGRLDRCLPIGDYRQRAYRVREELLAAWGGISAKGGYLLRSAVFPSLLYPQKCSSWWSEQKRTLVRQEQPGVIEPPMFHVSLGKRASPFRDLPTVVAGIYGKSSFYRIRRAGAGGGDDPA